MDRVRIDGRSDRAKLLAALEAAGHKGVTVAETPEGLFLEVPKGVDALRVSLLAREHRRRALVAAVRAAKPGTAEMRDALADALEALLL